MSCRVDTIVAALDAASLLVETQGTLPSTIAGLTDDSRSVVSDGAFIAVRGTVQDGHRWLSAAANAGATMAIVEDPSATDLSRIVVRDGRRAAAVAAAAFYGHPASGLNIIGVTGTNGKTTTVGLLRHLFDEPGRRAASIGTLGVLVGSEGDDVPGGHGLTTPGPVELQRVLRDLAGRGARTVAMEVSSHSLHQRRVEGVQFASAVFTNLTRDHLDYHGSMDDYRASKLMLLDLLAPGARPVVNADDPAWRDMPGDALPIRFGTSPDSDVSADTVSFASTGSTFTLVTPDGRAHVRLPLIGDFNVHNALGAAACAHALGMPTPVIASRLSSMPQTPGRLERIHASPTVLRDYAHTPDALERALRAVRPFVRTPDDEPARLVVVFGCGGDRDRGKRPVMGAIAERLADAVIVTSDNPRTEDPERILDDIEAGMARRDHTRIEDRRAAIAQALAIAGAEDVVVLAGKGHETYQIRGTTSYPFDERAIVAALFEGSSSADASAVSGAAHD